LGYLAFNCNIQTLALRLRKPLYDFQVPNRPFFPSNLGSILKVTAAGTFLNPQLRRLNRIKIANIKQQNCPPKPCLTMTFEVASNLLDAFPARLRFGYAVELVATASFALLIWWTVRALSISHVGTYFAAYFRR
jgi:hypothetical protein